MAEYSSSKKRSLKSYLWEQLEPNKTVSVPRRTRYRNNRKRALASFSPNVLDTSSDSENDLVVDLKFNSGVTTQLHHHHSDEDLPRPQPETISSSGLSSSDLVSSANSESDINDTDSDASVITQDGMSVVPAVEVIPETPENHDHAAIANSSNDIIPGPIDIEDHDDDSVFYDSCHSPPSAFQNQDGRISADSDSTEGPLSSSTDEVHVQYVI